MFNPRPERIVLAARDNDKREFNMRLHVIRLEREDLLPRLQVELLYHVYYMPVSYDDDLWQVVLTSDLYHLFSLEVEETETKERLLVSRLLVLDNMAKNRQQYLGRFVATGQSLFDAAWKVYKYVEKRTVAYPSDVFVRQFLATLGFGEAATSAGNDSNTFGIVGDMMSLLKELFFSFFKIASN